MHKHSDKLVILIMKNHILWMCSFLMLSFQEDRSVFATVEDCINNLHIWDTRGFHDMENKTTFTQEDSLKILATLPRLNDVMYTYALASMKMAYREFCMRGGVPDFKTELIFIDDKCSPSTAIPIIVDLKNAGLDVIFGVKCSKVTIPSGYYLTHWDIPLISLSSNNPDISDKDVYSTVIRVGMGYKQIGYAFVELFKAFEWTQASMVTEDDGLCIHGSNYVNVALKENNLRVAEYTFVERRGELSDDFYREMLQNFRERARILIVCMSHERITRLMEIAMEKDMISPEFVYLSMQIQVTEVTFTPWGDSGSRSVAELQKIQEAFKHLKIVTPINVDALALPDFAEEARLEMARLPGLETNITVEEIQEHTPLSVGLYFYDTLRIFLDVVNETSHTGEDPTSGKFVFDKMRNIIIEGKSGEVIMDDDADRIPIYWMWQLSPSEQRFSPVATLRTVSPEGERVQLTGTPYWGTADGLPPPDIPVCGFRNELCPPDHSGRDKALIGGFTALALVIILGFCSFIYYKKKQFEENLQKMTWKILYQEIDFFSKGKRQGSKIGLSTRSIASAVSQNSDTQSKTFSIISGQNQIFTSVATYKGTTCAIKKIENPDYKTSREDLIQLKLMKDLNHENLNTFIGVCFHGPTIYVLTVYCSRGSLEDILEQDEIKLDWMFKTSLIQDLTNGMAFLHNSELVSHGNLKSPNCLIDGRWVLKVSNFGLQMLKPTKATDTRGEYEKYKDDLWTAPELLRMDEPPPNGSQKGDVYSFAIILQEILFRALPYFTDDTTPQEVISKVKDPSTSEPYRPKIPKATEETDPVMLDIMKDCWEENPASRPEFTAIRKTLAQMNKGKKVNILDNMVAKLESYANNLEDIVEKRTEELVEEKKKTDLLLYRMLPSVVAEKLKHGLPVAAEIFESVTIYFSDVVGFTSIASASTPVEIVNLLNDLYTLFDASIAKYDVYKVETIGDAYMCVSGLPNRNNERHASEIADMSLDLRRNLNKFKIRHMPERPLMIRIGLHSGSCAAGVVGLTMPRYCLFGDTVNVASRMESNGAAMKIHISQSTCDLLKVKEKYEITERGKVELKGKGLVDSYWLDEKNGFSE